MKLSALFVALTMVVGLMVTPAAASDGDVLGGGDFYEWSLGAQRGDEYWQAIYGDTWDGGSFDNGLGVSRGELVEKYGAYTGTMQTELGTTTLVEGSKARVYFDFPTPCWGFTGTGVLTSVSNTGGTRPMVVAEVTYQSSQAGKFRLGYEFGDVVAPRILAPFTGYREYGATFIADYDTVGYYTPNAIFSAEPYSCQAGDELQCATMEWGIDDNEYDGRIVSIAVRQWIDFTPLAGAGLPVTVDVTDYSRTGILVGDVYVVNDNGEEIVYNEYSVVNETTNIYSDPISGTERPIEDWAYDYIERQYNITLEDGASVTVKYGDENIEIVEGDSIETLNYGSGSSGEGNGGGTGIGDAIANLFTVLGEIILGLITAIINLATKALDALTGLFGLFGQMVETITGFFGGFTDFLAGVFPFLPEETFTIFNFGLILLVAATVFRKFLK